MRRSWFEYDYKMPPKFAGSPLNDWRRSRFIYRPTVFGASVTDPTGDEQAKAQEMLVVLKNRYRSGTRFRLVLVSEEIVGEEVVTPDYRED